MASIYESQGPQVALTGPQTQGGFQLGQAYDASSMMLRQSERDLNAFAQFSESLTGFLQNKAKQKNEEEYQLGLAEVLDGTVTPTPTQTDQYQASATLLQNAASADNQVSNQLSNQGQLAAGEQFKAQSQAISGWRSYGRAVGSAKQVATNAQSFFLMWENNKEKVVPLPDGRMISPAEARAPDEILASLAVGQQTLIKQSNIRNINPVIIAEHLAPTIQAVKAQMFANKLSSEVRKAKETAVSDITGVISSEFSNPDLGVPGMSESFQRNVEAFVIEGGLGRGEASDKSMEIAAAAIATLPEDVSKPMLEQLGQVRKIANDPNSLTLLSAYPTLFANTLDTIEGRVEAEEAKQERKLGKQAEQAWGLLKKAEQDATQPAGELQALRKQTIGILGKLADQGSTDALKYRTELLADPINVDYTLYRQYREGIFAQGKRPSQEQIQRDIQSGKLTVEMGRELGVYATSSDEEAFKKQFGSDISEAVVTGLKERGAVSLDPFNRPETNVLHVKQVTNDLVNNVYRWRKAQIAKGQTPDDNDINQFVINELPRTIGRYFQQNPNTKAWTTRPISKNPALTPNRIKSSLSGPVRDASGFNPRTIELRSYNGGSTVIMSKAEVEDNIQRIASNQPMTRRAEQLANSQGGPVQLLTNQAKHYGIDTKPILSSPEAQRLSQYSAAAPWATKRYNAAGGNYRQQMFQLQRIVEAQARAANAGKGPAPTVTVKSGPSVGTKDLIKLGLSQGLTPEKAITMAAVALGESGGRPSAHNPNRSTGDNSYGLWQINMIDELGPERARALGIKDYNQLKDPNVNARAMKMILNSQGLNAWSVHRNRLHLQYLPEARRAYAELKREM